MAPLHHLMITILFLGLAREIQGFFDSGQKQRPVTVNSSSSASNGDFTATVGATNLVNEQTFNIPITVHPTPPPNDPIHGRQVLHQVAFRVSLLEAHVTKLQEAYLNWVLLSTFLIFSLFILIIVMGVSGIWVYRNRW